MIFDCVVFRGEGLLKVVETVESSRDCRSFQELFVSLIVLMFCFPRVI